MVITMLKSKIHRAVVTEANLNYVGSITLDKDLMDASGIYEYEKVYVVDIDNGNRLETYVISGEAGSGVICLNGASARLVHTGDKIIIMAFCQLNKDEIKEHEPRVVFVDKDNRIVDIKNMEEHGEIR